MDCFSEGSGARERVLTDLDLLQHIFSELDLTNLLQAVPLVCRAWRDAQASPGRCWEALEIDGLRLTKGPPVASQQGQRLWRRLAAWLARRAGGLRQLRLANLRHLLQALEDGERLAALAQLWHALGGGCGGGGACAAPALHALDIGRSSIGLAPGTVAAMACLPQLRVVRLHTASHLEFAELDSLAGGLPLLEALHVCLMRRRGEFCAFRGAFPRRLAGLRRLRSLRLEAPYSALNAPSCALPEAVDGWSEQLEELHLINLGLESLPASIGGLRKLRELCLGRNRLGLRPNAIPWEVTQLTSLTRLELQYNGFEAGPPAVVGELPSLVELNIGGNLWGSACSDLPPEYAQLTRLRYLTLTNCELSALPPVVRCLPSLELLKLNINKIQTLPGGPYLRRLEGLDLSHNRFTAGYPAALAAASRLEIISFQHDGRHYSDPAVALRDALAPLPPPGDPPAQQGTAAAAAAAPVVTAVALPLAFGI
ncbi:hypothetical protein ABPG75_013938 [Micractinium tetrahymenae]